MGRRNNLLIGGVAIVVALGVFLAWTLIFGLFGAGLPLGRRPIETLGVFAALLLACWGAGFMRGGPRGGANAVFLAGLLAGVGVAIAVLAGYPI